MSVELEAYVMQNALQEVILRVHCDPSKESQIRDKMIEIRKNVIESGENPLLFLEEGSIAEEFSGSFSQFAGTDQKGTKIITFESCFWVRESAEDEDVASRIASLIAPFFPKMVLDLHVEHQRQPSGSLGERAGAQFEMLQFIDLRTQKKM